MRNVPHWVSRALDVALVLEALEWIVGGALCLVLAAVVWQRPIPPGDDTLLRAASHYRSVGVSLFVAFGVFLCVAGIRQAIRAARRRP